MNTLLHTHTSYSLFDGAQTDKELCQAAKNAGYDAVVLTNHGVMIFDDFVAAAKETGIKPILGCEIYVKEEGSDDFRAHCVVVAKDTTGYKGLCKLSVLTNERMDSYGFPLADRDMLAELFGEGSEFHGHVYVTSACMGGILGVSIIRPIKDKEKIAKLVSKQSKYVSADDIMYRKAKDDLANLETEIVNSTEKKKELQVLSKKAYKKRENAVEKLAGTPEYDIEKAKLDAEKKESADAVKAIDEISVKIAVMTGKKKELKANVDSYESSIANYNNIAEKIKAIEDHKSSAEDIYAETVKTVKFYQAVFGKENFFIELQYHGFMDGTTPIEEIEKTTELKIAKELNVPLVIGSDAHMSDGSKESIRKRQILRTLRFASKGGSASTVEPGDTELYVKTKSQTKDFLGKIFDQESIDKAMSNTDIIGDSCSFEYSSEKHYPTYCDDAEKVLREKVYNRIDTVFPGRVGWTDVYEKRLEYELGVICSMGYANYFLVEDFFLTRARKLGYLTREHQEYVRTWVKNILAGTDSSTIKDIDAYIDAHQELPGFSVGYGRGSGAGSLTTYLLGITNCIDPIKYDLLFERFLNPSRVSMPDIDSDFSDDVRDITVDLCRIRFGKESVAKIMTSSYMQPKGAIKSAARVIGIEKDQRDLYLSYANEIVKLIPGKPGTTFNDCIDTLNNRYSFAPGDKEEEKKKKTNIQAIIKDALLIEGCLVNHGIHAAGVIIGDGHPISDYIPEKITELGLTVQCDHDQAEGLHHLLKFDFLGLKNLVVITDCIRMIYKKTGKWIDPLKITFDDSRVFEEIFSTGRTDSVFQFESDGMKSLLKSFKPTCIEDVIALVSLYRPGPMDFIPQYVDAKWHPETIHYLVPELEPILKTTYGVMVYQEQVMAIFQRLAGYSLADADNVRRFMAKKKLEPLVKEKEAFINGDAARNIKGCVANGISKEKASELFESMLSFASYAFNKSHAAVYSAISYVTAYLKLYYTEEYMASVLNHAENVDAYYKVFTSAADFGIKILPPDVNISGEFFEPEQGAIMFGMNSVKGTRAGAVDEIISEREKNGKFVSFLDFLKRCKTVDKATVEALAAAGGFDEFSDNRFAVVAAYTQMSDVLPKITKKEEAIAAAEAEGAPTGKRAESQLKRTKDSLVELKNQLSLISINDAQPESKRQRLINEKKALGFFISGHLMDFYRAPESAGCLSISKITSNLRNVEIMGVIQNVVLKSKNGKNMAFFDLEDKTGSIHICCFSKAYDEFGHLITENEVVKITGRIDVDTDDVTNEEHIEIIMQDCVVLKEDLKTIIVKLPNGMYSELEICESLKKHGLIEASGHPLSFYDERESELRRTGLYVNEAVLTTNGFKASV